jgi:monoamine oxidase
MKRLINDSNYPTTTPAGAYMAMTYGVEYGGPIESSSALSMVLEQGNFWGPSSGYDERWQFLGGMTMLPETLAALLPSPVQMNQSLAAIVRNGNDTYTLTFKSGGATTTVVADRVVLAIPPSALRQVDCTKAGFSPNATKAIAADRMGTVNKLAFQFAGRPWSDNNRSGDAVSDGPTGMAWQESFLSTNPATLVVLNQRNYGATAAHGVAPAGVTTEMMTALDSMWPGSSAKLIAGQSYLDNWTQDPYAKGCYPYYKVNGFTTYGGYQGKREGEIYFAGDWATTYVERATVCGAVSSAERIAARVTNH